MGRPYRTVPCRSRRRYSRFGRSGRDAVLNCAGPVCKWRKPSRKAFRRQYSAGPPVKATPPAAPTAALRSRLPTPAAVALRSSRPNPDCAGIPAANESGTTDGEPPAYRPFAGDHLPALCDGPVTVAHHFSQRHSALFTALPNRWPPRNSTPAPPVSWGFRRFF